MDIAYTAMAAVLVIAFIVLVIMVCYIVSGKKKRQTQYQSQNKKVFVKSGINVKKQVLGEEKGEYFTGNLEERGTYYINGANAVKSWRVVFDNLSTGERVYMDFSRQMWIGRGNSENNNRSKLEVMGDGKISRNHCTIYELNNALCIQDLKSSNHTYLNGRLLYDAAYLNNGDIITVGNTKLRVQYSL